jgi:hypothetical protein
MKPEKDTCEKPSVLLDCPNCGIQPETRQWHTYCPKCGLESAFGETPQQCEDNWNSSMKSKMKTQWLPIETAPKDDTIIDLWAPDDGRLINYRREQLSPTNIFYSPVEDGICVVRNATHWMPLPDPPDACK